jgi:rod shape-determining protein MreC
MGYSSARRLLGRRNGRQFSKSRIGGAIVLIGVTFCLLAVTQQFPGQVAEARARLAGPVSSILAQFGLALKPFAQLKQVYLDHLGMEQELARLRAENDELRAWKWRALDLEWRIADLKDLNNLVNEPRVDFVTAAIVGHSAGGYGHSTLISAGVREGVVGGASVLGPRGLVGSTYEVGPRTSRVLFLTDTDSRVRVRVGKGLVNAVGVGTGGPLVNLVVEGSGGNIAVGDEVVTAGSASGSVRGLRVGRVVASPGGLGIEPYTDFRRLEYLSVLLPQVRDPGRLVKGDLAHVTARLGGGRWPRGTALGVQRGGGVTKVDLLRSKGE